MPRLVQTLPTSDFRGGINYNADAFQLADNEVSDALNVDFDPRGGFRRRHPSQTINGGAAITDALLVTQVPKNIWTFTTSDGATAQIMAQAGNDAAYSTGANFTGINPDAGNIGTGIMYAATANDKCYVVRDANLATWTWTGAAAAVLTDSHGAYNDNIAAPAGGKFPKARYVARHRNYMFCAVINEAGTIRRNRLRFSHPFSDLTGTKGVEDWRTNDWIDLPGDGDTITGIVSWQDELIVFKNNSVWVVRGFGPDSFQLENISKAVGAVGQRAIAVGEEGVYFFSWPDGLQLYDGKGVRNLWFQMQPVTDRTLEGTTIDGLQADAGKTADITIGYVNNRVWCSMTSTGASMNNMTFVFDPALSKGGGWTRYDLTLGAYTTLHPPGGDRKWYAVCYMVDGEVHQLENHVLGWRDRMGNADFDVPSNVYTRWYDLGNPALIKRWKHPIFVIDSQANQVLPVSVYRDYDFTSAHRFFDLSVTAIPTVTWGGTTWGGSVWSPDTVTGAQVIEKGGLLGRATAVALKIEGPVTVNQPWAINSITWKYIPRKVRS